MIPLSIPNVTLRPFRASDAASLARHANNPKVAMNLRDRFPSPYTIEDARGWIAFAESTDRRLHLAIAVNDEACGGIGVELEDDVNRLSGEIGYWLSEEHWGKGIGTAALKAMTEHAFATFEICRLFAPVYERNRASARVLEKAGYVLEARLKKAVIKGGVVMDELRYACVR